MGPTWSEKYLVPTQVFFETLITEWNLLKEENITEEVKEFLNKIID